MTFWMTLDDVRITLDDALDDVGCRFWMTFSRPRTWDVVLDDIFYICV